MVYLREPVTSKEVQEGEDFNASGLHYGLAAMQGWRRNMEDAHLAVTELDDKVALFGVFDGHGGRGVSRFAAGKLPGLLRENEAYQKGDYVKALEQSFLAVDEKLREAAGRKEIETLDRPDAGAAIHPMVVPRKVLQRFLGNSPGQGQEDGGGAGAEQAAAGERPPDGEAGASRQEDGKPDTPQEPAGQEDKDGKPDAPEEPAGQEDKENRPAASEENADDAETEEEQGVEDGAQGENEGETDDGEDGGAEQGAGEAEDNEDWEDDDMALVDPSRLTRDPTPEAQGCTAVVVLVVRRADGEGPRLFCANAGDSRAILSRAGRVVALSEDHKPENAGETARIVKAGGFVQQMPGGARVQGDLNLSRAFGDLRYKKPENLPPEEQIVTAFPEVRVFPMSGEEDEFMVLGCDGIWERMGNQEMVDFVRPRIASMIEKGQDASLTKICSEVCDTGLCPSMDTNENQNFDGTGCDNMTIMIVRLRRELAADRKRPADSEPEPESKRQKPDEQKESGEKEQT